MPNEYIGMGGNCESCEKGLFSTSDRQSCAAYGAIDSYGFAVGASQEWGLAVGAWSMSASGGFMGGAGGSWSMSGGGAGGAMGAGGAWGMSGGGGMYGSGSYSGGWSMSGGAASLMGWSQSYFLTYDGVWRPCPQYTIPTEDGYNCAMPYCRPDEVFLPDGRCEKCPKWTRPVHHGFYCRAEICLNYETLQEDGSCLSMKCPYGHYKAHMGDSECL